MTAGPYVEGVLGRDRGVLSRTITLIESTRPADRSLAREVLAALLPRTGGAVRLGVTGAPGAGKSTLIEAIGRDLLAKGHRVAVLAVDPSSRVSGGSILGDKTRMATLSRDPDAFVRPSPAGDTPGGVASRTREALLVCEAAGFDVAVVETVGVGQSETAVADMVDTVVAVMIAGAGDELQGLKRGLVETADVFVVNKADGDNRPRAFRAAAQLRYALHLTRPADGAWSPPVLTCSALEGLGLKELWDAVAAHRAAIEGAGLFHERRRDQAVRWMWDLVHDRVRRALAGSPAVRDLAARLEADVRDGRATADAASEAIVRALGIEPG